MNRVCIVTRWTFLCVMLAWSGCSVVTEQNDADRGMPIANDMGFRTPPGSDGGSDVGMGGDSIGSDASSTDVPSGDGGGAGPAKDGTGSETAADDATADDATADDATADDTAMDDTTPNPQDPQDTGNPNDPLDHTNVVVILFDDLGIGDLGSYGGTKIRTPKMDQMAAEGMRFTNFYVGPWCGPTRSALMQGKRLGYTHIRNVNKPLPGSLPLLPKSLKNAGYHTGMFGKWGLSEVTGGYHIGEPFTIHEGSPEGAGFNEFVGFLTHRDAHVFYLDNPATPAEDSPQHPYYDDIRRQMFKIQGGVTVPHIIAKDRYVHDEFADGALAFIDKNAQKPFFLYIPLTVPHVELIAPEDEIIQYYRGLNWPEEAYVPMPGSSKKRPQPETYATYAAMVERADRDIGRILEALHDNGLAENTLVLLASDNGPLLGNYRSGQHVDFFNSAAGKRGFKWDMWEGGVAAPLIAWWPKTIPASTTSDVRVGIWDFFPTIAEATGAQVPGEVNGKSFLPVLTQGSTAPLYDAMSLEGWTSENWTGKAQVVMQGDLKLVRRRIGTDHANTSLYNLAADSTEEWNIIFDNIGTANTLINVMNTDRDPMGDEFFLSTQNPLPMEDTVVGTCNNDDLTGTDGPDRIRGLSGNDVIGGQTGPDYIHGNKGDDTIYGGKNGDLLFGGQGTDTLYGDFGDDILSGDLGNDTLEDSSGHEEYRFELGAGADTINDPQGRNKIVFLVPNPNAEQIVTASIGNDLVVSLQGRPDTVTILGVAGSDAVWSFHLKQGNYDGCDGGQVGQCLAPGSGRRCKTDPKWNGALWIPDEGCASLAGGQCGAQNPAQKGQCHPHTDGLRCAPDACSVTGYAWYDGDLGCCPANVVQCGAANPAQQGQCHPANPGQLCMATPCPGTATGHRWAYDHPACL